VFNTCYLYTIVQFVMRRNPEEYAGDKINNERGLARDVMCRYKLENEGVSHDMRGYQWPGDAGNEGRTERSLLAITDTTNLAHLLVLVFFLVLISSGVCSFFRGKPLHIFFNLRLVFLRVSHEERCSLTI